jgi:hypothetical protein
MIQPVTKQFITVFIFLMVSIIALNQTRQLNKLRYIQIILIFIICMCKYFHFIWIFILYWPCMLLSYLFLINEFHCNLFVCNSIFYHILLVTIVTSFLGFFPDHSHSIIISYVNACFQCLLHVPICLAFMLFILLIFCFFICWSCCFDQHIMLLYLSAYHVVLPMSISCCFTYEHIMLLYLSAYHVVLPISISCCFTYEHIMLFYLSSYHVVLPIIISCCFQLNVTSY